VKDTESSKSVSDTPETDRLLSDQHHDCIPYDDAAEQLAELCQKLEHERDNLRADQSNQEDMLLRYMDEIDEANNELNKQLIRYDALFDEAEKIRSERDVARKLANGAMLEADIIRGKLERERAEAQRLLAAAKESLNAIHVEVGGWIAAMMKEGK
jgi:tRNA U55 pseudouridine synthase TruB